MGLAMQAAAEADIPFVVLDRPNPLGGEYVSGFVLESSERSFVGQYPIPLVHGLTIGELANFIKDQELIPGLDKLKLTVIPIKGWQRWMRWPDTNLSWKKTSPNIVSFESALVYPGVALLEATSVSDGRGTATPFTIVGFPGANPQRIAQTLNDLRLPGVLFEPTQFVPRALKGMESSPAYEGRVVQGVRIVVVDFHSFQPVETGIHILRVFYEELRASAHPGFISRAEWLNKLAGTKRLYEMLVHDAKAHEIIASWASEVQRYKMARSKYLLY
jgi:uncharacterized protein YbbC (DUF1343 family)